MKNWTTSKHQQPITRVAVVGDEKKRVEDKLARFGMHTDTTNPQAIISFGGDGTALRAEAHFQGVPRLPIRNSPICNLCEIHDLDTALLCLSSGSFTIRPEHTIEVTLLRNGKTIAKMRALNDINIHYIPPQAMRMRVSIGAKKLIASHHRHDERTHYAHDIFIGDGVLIATPHGSTAYFHSITRKRFSTGIGLAFNNPIHPAPPHILGLHSRIIIEIIRGPGVLAADSNAHPITLRDHDKIIITSGKRDAHIIMLDKTVH